MLAILPEPWVLASIGAGLFVAAGLAAWLLGAIRLAIYLGAAGLICATAAGTAHEYEARGSAKVQALWDADKAVRIQRTTEITLALSAKLMEAKDAASRLEGQLRDRFATLEGRASGVATRGGIGVGDDVARLLDDTSRAANSARPDAGTKAGTAAVPDAAAPEVVAYDEREFAGFIVAAGAAYADAYQLWRACRGREDSYLEAMTKGRTQ
jgi:hypothetical protein